jgi:hypothetical protein
MPKFKITWVNTVTEYWEDVVEADTLEEANECWNNDSFPSSDSVLVDSSIEFTDLDSIEEIKIKKTKKGKK